MIAQNLFLIKMFLLMSTGNFFIKTDTLTFQNAAYFPSVERQISKTKDPNDITVLDSDTFWHNTLQPADDASSHNHHDEEAASLAGMFSKTAYG